MSTLTVQRVDAFSTGRQHAIEGLKFYLPENCTVEYRRRYAIGYLSGTPYCARARATKLRYFQQAIYHSRYYTTNNWAKEWTLSAQEAQELGYAPGSHRMKYPEARDLWWAYYRRKLSPMIVHFGGGKCEVWLKQK